jgi:NAD(P)-dependent dehydrogenase (short-subunit alcohol dehydrogenase family)
VPVTDWSAGSSYFSGRVALVTGGGSGVGAEVARMMAHCGARVFVVDIDGDRAKAVANEIDGVAYSIDVADPPSWDSLNMEQPPSIAFLNAGVVTKGAEAYDIDALTRAEVTRALGANFLGVLHGLRRLIPAMRESGSARICLNASAAGILPLEADPLYTATKHALVGLGRAASSSLGRQGVLLTTLCPTTPTDAPEPTPQAVAQAALDLIEFGEAGEIRMVRSDGVHLVEMELRLHRLDPSERTAGIERPLAE